MGGVERVGRRITSEVRWDQSHLIPLSSHQAPKNYFACSVPSTVYSVPSTLYSVQCTQYIVQCTQYSVQCTQYSVQCTVCSVPRGPTGQSSAPLSQCDTVQTTGDRRQCTVYSLQITVDN